MFKIGDQVLINTSRHSITTATIESGTVISIKECTWEDVDAPDYTLGIEIDFRGIYYRFACDVSYDVDTSVIDELLEL